jgi:hypothetical protein
LLEIQSAVFQFKNIRFQVREKKKKKFSRFYIVSNETKKKKKGEGDVSLVIYFA